jgi:hypothetical protein
MTVIVPDLPKAEAAIVEMTNAFRRENRLAEVAANAKLSQTAKAFAEFLAKSNLFSHTADGRQPADRIKSGGYTYCQVAENLALNFDSRGFETRQLAGEAIDGWKKSPGHRKNMLAPHVTEIGVGIAKAKSEEKYLSVQLFGRPDSLKYEFRINNLASATVSYAFGDAKHTLEPSYSVRHTSCLPGEVVMEQARSGQTRRTLNARYQARNGDVFVVRGATPADVAVEVTRPQGATSNATAPVR